MTTRDIEIFSVWDYVVFALFLVISAAIGVYYAFTGGKQKTASEFLFGDRKMPLFPVAMSVLATCTSAAGILGSTAEIYRIGGILFCEVFSVCIAVVLTVVFYLPVFYNLHLSSLYEYLERRFNKFIRRMTMLGILVNNLIYMAVCLYGPASALSQATGFSLYVSVISSGSVCALYTFLGGMKAVLWTDTVQQILVFVGLIFVAAHGCYIAGGINRVWAIAEAGGRTGLFDVNPDPTIMYSTWNFVLGNSIGWLFVYSCNQSMVQRYLTVETLKISRWTVLLSIPIFSAVAVLYLLCGLVLYSKYADCDPLLDGKIEKYEQILPLFVMETLGTYKGVPGLFVAAIFSSSLSAISSGLSCFGAIMLEDVYKPLKKHFYNKDVSETEGAKFSKITVAVFGVLSVALAFIVPLLGRTLFLVVKTLLVLFAGPILGIFTLGLFVPVANSQGTGLGAILGFGATLWLVIGGFFHKTASLPAVVLSISGCNSTWTNSTSFIKDSSNYTNLIGTEIKFVPISLESIYRISFLYFPAVGFFTTFIFGSLFSLPFRSKTTAVDNELLFSLCRRRTRDCNKRTKNYKDIQNSHHSEEKEVSHELLSTKL